MFWQRVASLIKFIYKQKKSSLRTERPRYEFSAAVFKQNLQAAVFPVKSRKLEERRQTWTIHCFRSFIYSLPTQQYCVLPLAYLPKIF